MNRLILGAAALCAVGATALTTGGPAMAQHGSFGMYYNDGYRGRDGNSGYSDQRYRRYDRGYRHRNGRTPMGGYNPSGCYFDEGGGRIYSCDAGGRR